MSENKFLLPADRVVIKYNDSFDLIRYKKFNDLEAIVLNYSVEEDGYSLRFIDDEVQSEYVEDGGGLYFKREWLEKIGDNKELYNIYTQTSENFSTPNIGKPPKFRNIKLFNFAELCEFLEKNGRKNVKDRLSNYVEYTDKDDSVLILHLNRNFDKLDKELQLDLLLIKKVFNEESDFICINKS